MDAHSPQILASKVKATTSTTTTMVKKTCVTLEQLLPWLLSCTGSLEQWRQPAPGSSCSKMLPRLLTCGGSLKSWWEPASQSSCYNCCYGKWPSLEVWNNEEGLNNKVPVTTVAKATDLRWKSGIMKRACITKFPWQQLPRPLTCAGSLEWWRGPAWQSSCSNCCQGYACRCSQAHTTASAGSLTPESRPTPRCAGWDLSPVLPSFCLSVNIKHMRCVHLQATLQVQLKNKLKSTFTAGSLSLKFPTRSKMLWNRIIYKILVCISLVC